MFVLILVLFLILIELGVREDASFILVALWSIIPAHSELLMWISSRKDLLALLYGCLSVLFFLFAEKRQNFLLFACCLFLFICSLLCKASLTLLPMIGLLLFVLRLKKLNIRTLLTLYIGVGIGLVNAIFQAWFYSHVNCMQTILGFPQRLQSSAAAFFKMFGAFFYYNWNIVDIENTGRWVDFNHTLIFWGYLSWIILVIVFIVSVFNKWKAFIFVLLSSAMLYFPTSGILFPHRNVFSVRYLEPAFLFMFLFAGILFLRKTTTDLSKGLTLILAVLFAFGTYKQGRIWSDPLSVAKFAVQNNPEDIGLKINELYELTFLSESNKSEESRVEYENLLSRVQTYCDEAIRFAEPLNAQTCRRFYYLSWHQALLLKKSELASENLKKLKDSYLASRDFKGTIVKSELDNSLVFGHLEKGIFDNWITTVRWFPQPKDRLQRLVISCYTSNETVAKGLLREYLAARLLELKNVNDFVKELFPSISQKISKCLSLSDDSVGA